MEEVEVSAETYHNEALERLGVSDDLLLNHKDGTFDEMMYGVNDVMRHKQGRNLKSSESAEIISRWLQLHGYWSTNMKTPARFNNEDWRILAVTWQNNLQEHYKKKLVNEFVLGDEFIAAFKNTHGSKAYAKLHEEINDARSLQGFDVLSPLEEAELMLIVEGKTTTNRDEIDRALKSK